MAETPMPLPTPPAPRPSPPLRDLAERIATAPRLSPETRLGLALYLSGVSVRRAAELVGRDFSGLHRLARGLGIADHHRAP